MRKLLVVLGLSFVCCPAWAEDAALPAAVAKAVGELTKTCTDAGGKASTTAALRRTDINADGNADFVLDVGSFDCQGAAAIFGDREKPVQVFLADGAGGAEVAYTHSAYGVKLEGAGPQAKVWLLLTAEGCGKPKARFANEESYCDRPLVWNEKTKKVELAPLSAAKPVR
jgi:hypothetical protein